MRPISLLLRGKLCAAHVVILLYILLALGAGLRIFDCFQHNPLDYLFSDPRRHWDNGARIFDVGTKDLMSASDPIGYQLYVFLLRFFTCDQRLPIAAVGAILSVAMPWTYYRAGREAGLSKTAGLATWAILEWMPSLFVIYHYIMMETLLLLLEGVALWATARVLRKKSLSSFLWATGLWVIALLTKPTLFPLAALALLYVWWSFQRRWSWAIGAILVTALLSIPNSIRTHRMLGFACPLGNPWITVVYYSSDARGIRVHWHEGKWEFSSPSCYLEPLEPLSSWMLRRAKENTVVDISPDRAPGAQGWKEAYMHLPSVNFLPGLNRWLENMILILFSPSWPDDNRHEWDGWIQYHMRWLWAPLIFWVIGCNLQIFKSGRFPLIPTITAVFAILLICQNSILTEGRYRKVLEPLLILNAALVIVDVPRPFLPKSRNAQL